MKVTMKITPTGRDIAFNKVDKSKLKRISWGANDDDYCNCYAVKNSSPTRGLTGKIEKPGVLQITGASKRASEADVIDSMGRFAAHAFLPSSSKSFFNLAAVALNDSAECFSVYIEQPRRRLFVAACVG